MIRQLRDMIKCPFNQSDLFLVYGNSVIRYNAATQQGTQLLKDLAHAPSAMTVKYNYLATGNQRSHVFVQNLDTNHTGHVSVGGSINNAIEISKHLNDTRLLVCNNDQMIKIFSLPSLVKVDQIAYPVSVNYSAVSHDERKMVVVGDSNQVFLHDVSEATPYKRIATLTTTSNPSKGASFSCSWNANSDKFAVASQDGFVFVWDIRSQHQLACFPAYQQGTHGACRKVQFSPSATMDLLLFSEHMNYIHIVDARTFEQRQAIRVSNELEERNINGITFSPDSRSVYVALDKQIVEYEIDTHSRRTFASGSFR